MQLSKNKKLMSIVFALCYAICITLVLVMVSFSKYVNNMDSSDKSRVAAAILKLDGNGSSYHVFPNNSEISDPSPDPDVHGEAYVFSINKDNIKSETDLQYKIKLSRSDGITDIVINYVLYDISGKSTKTNYDDEGVKVPLDENNETINIPLPIGTANKWYRLDLYWQYKEGEEVKVPSSLLAGQKTLIKVEVIGEQVHGSNA